MTGDTTRRRGQELEDAILSAAWEELAEVGYGGLTFEGVAARAQTSRPVIYRRWANRADLATAALRHYSAVQAIDMPDCGNLRDDMLALLRQASSLRSRVASLIGIQMAQFFSETGMTPAELRELMIAGRGRTPGMQTVLERAAARGEVDLSRITPRMANVAIDLMRHDLLLTLQPLSDKTIVEIVDEIFLPLVTAGHPKGIRSVSAPATSRPSK